MFISLNIFSQNHFEEYISIYSGKGNLGIRASLNFEIDEPMSFEVDVKFINNRYFIVEILKPEIFIGINYTYDINKGLFYTKQNQEVDAYSEVSVITASIPSIFNTLFISFQPNKLNKVTKEEENFLIETYMPKSMNMLRLLGVDFIKFKVHFSKPVKGIYTFSKFEILNSDETKKIIMKIDNIKFLNEEDSYKIINEFLNK
jgi:hypothetical protein